MSLDTATQPPTADGPATSLAALLAALSLEEKTRLVVGAGLWSTTAIPHIGLRAMHVSDGPAGVRGVSDSADETSASFPAPSALAATWDVDLADELGHVFAAEARRQRGRRRARPGGEPAAHPGRRPALRVLLRGPAAHRRHRGARGALRAGPRRGGVRQALRRQRVRDAAHRVPRAGRRADAARGVPGAVRAARARGPGVVGHGRLQRARRRHHRRDRCRAPPAADRGAQGRVGLRRRRDERLGGHHVRRRRRPWAASTW